eukprot:4474277-Amphidinium_carterae.1
MIDKRPSTRSVCQCSHELNVNQRDSTACSDMEVLLLRNTMLAVVPVLSPESPQVQLFIFIALAGRLVEH